MEKFLPIPSIFFGDDALDELNNIGKDNIYIVTDKFIVDSGMIKNVTDIFDRKNLNYKIFKDVLPDPSIEVVTKGLKEIIEYSPKVIVGFGGGSPIDCAKAMLYFYMKVDTFNTKNIEKPLFVAIPTTSGTGSEVTSYAVITDTKSKVKIPLSDDVMTPDIAILENTFTKTLPKNLIANTGMDVLTHAIEGYVSSFANDFTKIFSKEAFIQCYRNLYELYKDANNKEKREKMYTASTMAGVGFTSASLGLNHGIAHTIGAEYKIPHGLANSIILPYVVAFNTGLLPYQTEHVRDRYKNLAESIGFLGEDEVESSKSIILAIQILNTKLSIKMALKDYIADTDDFRNRVDELADKILNDACTKANPVKVNKNELKKLLLDILDGVLEV